MTGTSTTALAIASQIADQTISEDDPAYTLEKWHIARDAALLAITVRSTPPKPAYKPNIGERPETISLDGPCRCCDGSGIFGHLMWTDNLPDAGAIECPGCLGTGRKDFVKAILKAKS